VEVTSALIVEEIRKHPDGRVDLLGLFEDFYVTGVPVAIEIFMLFLDLELHPDDKGRPHVLELRLIDPDGRPVGPARPIRFDVPADADYPRSTAQLDLPFGDVTFTAFGPHRLEVVIDGRVARRLYLGVRPQQQRGAS
jgi:hypothetical protein